MRSEDSVLLLDLPAALGIKNTMVWPVSDHFDQVEEVAYPQNISFFRLFLWIFKRTWDSGNRRVIIPVSFSFLYSFRFLACIVALLICAGTRGYCFTRAGRCFPMLDVPLSCFQYATAPFRRIITLPFFFVKEVLPLFRISKEEELEIIGYGPPRGGTGLDYWMTYAERVKKVGLFGFDRSQYLGVPYSVHTWPLALFFLSKLGFLKFIFLSVTITSAAFATLAIPTGNYPLLLLLPFVFLSTIFLLNITLGLWEALSWSFAVCAWVLVTLQFHFLAGVLLGASLLSHPGVFFLSALSTALLLFNSISLNTALNVFLGTALTSGWYLVVYLRNSGKLGRTSHLNNSFILLPREILVFSIYAAFIASLESMNVIYFASIPIFVFIFNKLRWIFSPYTVLHYMLFTGAYTLTVNYSNVSCILFFLLIFSDSAVLLGFNIDNKWGEFCSLKPFTYDYTKEKVLSLFSQISNPRIAFETEFVFSNINYYNTTLTSILTRRQHDVLNGFYTEIGPESTYKKFVEPFFFESDIKELHEACRLAGVTHIITHTGKYREKLRQSQMIEIAQIRDLRLSHHDYSTSDIYVFETGYKKKDVWGSVSSNIEGNRLEIDGRAGEDCLVLFNAYRGWEAYSSEGNPVPLQDMHPGIGFIFPQTQNVNSHVYLRYRYRNNFCKGRWANNE